MLNDIGEEFKKKPILMGILSDDYEEAAEKEFSDSEPTNQEKTEKSEDVAETSKPTKKGFFGRLFGKK